ncbi:type II toxin-antitoxin system VapC family toxin [Phormidium tenue]|jgi:predicted nucleic acid-binding protein|uniref:Ribonuclease VapC n=1 Tax=Phormidium tenue FACHB-1050 TaxID=2692857 RepID=A0ABR8CAU5_9CYAN|nr:type II toxin-antitoxin system VapC family toxin [Phormidium tenue]MBD2317883.1 type II toxin-antitoxin system VapC family toxin [Phormidium tenue FACHB-1050]
MIILDTNVLSEFMRAVPNHTVMDWIARQVSSEVFVTTITQAEMYYGLALLPVGKRRSDMERAVRQMFQQDFLERILTFDSAAALEYAKLASLRRQIGKPIAQADAQIAAIALSKNAVLATRNITDFCDCQITLVNPWEC